MKKTNICNLQLQTCDTNQKKKSKLNNLKNEMKKIHNTFAPSLNKQTKKYKKL